MLLALLFGVMRVQAQLTVSVTNPGNATPALSASYSSLASAITALNSSTAFSGQVILTCSGTSETAPVGGFRIAFTGTTTGTNNVIIDGSSNTVTAANLAATTAGVRTDAIFKIIGSDYVTIQNFTMTENAANTTGGAIGVQKMTEFGVALFASSATNGAQYNTIKNNTITLSTATKYQNAIGVFSSTASSETNSAQAAASVAGTNSFNMIYGNTISGVSTGIYFVSPAQTATVFESGNDIGGASLSTGNTITYGCSNTAGDLGFTSYSGTTAAGVYFRNVVGNSVRYNTITNVPTLTLASGGIFSANGTAPVSVPVYTSNFSNNTITITQTASVAINGIDFGSGTANGTITCDNNKIIINHTSILANTAVDIGIRANYVAASSSVNFNIVVLNEIFNPTATLTHSGALTGILLPSGTTGTPTMTAIGDSITISRSISVPATFTATLSGAIIGISGVTGATTFQIGNTGAGNGNVISMYEIPSASGTGTSTFSAVATGISVAGATGIATLNIVNNIIGSGRFKNYSTSTLTGINHGATLLGGTLNISTNTISFDRSLASATSTFIGISSGSSTITMPGGYSISDNTISFIGSQVAGSAGIATGITNSDGLAATTVNKSISNNTINLSGVMTSGTGITFSYGSTINVTNNTISINASVSGTQTATVTGIISGGTATTIVNVYSNIFNALNVTSTSSGTVSIFGVSVTGGSGTTNVYNHTITNISAGAGTGVATLAGISVTGGGTVATNVYKNKIYNIDMSNTNIASVISPIRIVHTTATTLINVYNNLIGQTNALNGVNNPNAVIGINIGSTALTSNINVYYNTVYLSSTSTGTNFGATGIFHTSNATGTTANLDLRNNIIVNNITPSGAGLSLAFRRSATALNNYATTSNNNLFYCTSGLYADGATIDSTASNMISRVSPREGSSVSEPLTFLNTGSPLGANFLMLDPAFATQVESGASSISGYNDDYLTNGARASYPLTGQVNGGGTSPDRGAQEMDLTPADLSGPAIAYTLVPSTTNTSAISLNATITDASGIPNSGAGLPTLYWRVGTTAPYATVTSTYVSGSTYNFVFGGGAVNDMISYYIVAQDNAATPNVTVSPSTGSATPTINPPAVGTAPTSPNTYTILDAWSGNYVIGGNGAGLAVGANYVSLTEAVGDALPNRIKSIYVTAGGTGYTSAPTISFTGGGGTGATAVAVVSGGVITRINMTAYGTGYTSAPTVVITGAGTGATATANLSGGKALSGPVTFLLSSNYDGTLYESVFPITIGDFGQTATNTVTIKPATGVNATISGSSLTSIIDLYGADYTTIDGSNNGTTSKNLTIRNTSTTATSSVVKCTSLGLGLGATYNTIKNCYITNGSTAVVNYGISISGTTANTAGADNDNITIQNNNISNCTTGIYASGTVANTSGGLDTLNITGNNVSFSATVTGCFGIRAAYALNATINQNIIDIETTNSFLAGISLETGFISSVVNSNRISKVKSTSTTASPIARGIVIGTGQTGSAVTISNNVIYNLITNYGTSTVVYNNAGIFIGSIGVSTVASTITGGINVYHNSINLYGNIDRALACLQYGLFIGSAATSLNINNNIFSNAILNINATAGLSKSYAIYCQSANTAFTSIDYNDYYVSGAQAVLGFLASDRTNLAGIQTGFGGNVNSLNVDPQYNSNTALLPILAAPVIGAGTPIGSVSTDYLGNARSVTAPSIGAYENGGDGAAPTITYTALANRQVTADSTLYATIQDLGTGAVGTDTTVNKARVYFKKSTDANVFGVTNNSTGNGWKYTTTSSVGSIDTLVIDYTLLQSAPAMNDVIQYFVVAQDYNGNVGASPSGGFEGTNVGTILNGPSTPNSFVIIGPPLAGNYTIGASVASSYPTITAATTDLNLRGISSSVLFELVDTAYTELTETFPINFGKVEGASISKTITFRPITGATSVRIGDSTNNVVATGIFNLNGATYYEFDGRAGGAGAIVTTLENHNTTGFTLRFINDAYKNTFKYMNIRGNQTSTATGTIIFSTTTGTIGNDTNTIDNCNIYESRTYPSNAIYNLGSIAAPNNNNIISNNNISNWGITGTCNGILISTYNNNITISNNSFYQTVSKTIAGTFTAINNSSSLNGGHIIANNYIGGSAPLCAGTPLTLNSAGTTFQTILLNNSATNASRIDGNTFKNMNITTTTSSALHSLIYLVNGRIYVGTASPNNLGSQTDTSNIVFNCGATSTTFSGVLTATALDTIQINNNLIGGITFNNVGTAGSGSLRGVDVGNATVGYVQINNNTIGGNIDSSMMLRTTGNIWGIGQRNTGSSNGYITQVNNNTIRNLVGASANSIAFGINSAGTAMGVEIKNNNINKITVFGTGTSHAINAGSNGTAGLTVSGNNIHTLKCMGTGGTFNGISALNAVTGTNVISQNLIHSFSAINDSCVMTGINLGTGSYTASNNMIRLGIDENGLDITTSVGYNGISLTAGSHNVYFNTVLIAGFNVGAGNDSTYAFRKSDALGTDNIRNNIFANTRVNTLSTGVHYAIRLAGTVANPSGLTLNNNNYFTTNSPLAFYNGNRAALSDFRTAVGLDANSISEAPVFVSSNGTSSTIDLHIIPATQSLMESGGANISGYATDFDGNARPGPAGSTNGGGFVSDIGADEFDGTMFPINMGAMLLASPSGPGSTCAISGKTVSIRIKNYSLSNAIDFAVNPVTVTASVSGSNPVTFTPVVLSTGTLAVGATQDIVFSTNYDMSAIGTYTFDAATSVTGDANPSNDVMPATNIVVTALTAGTVTSNENNFCNLTGSPTLTTTATGGSVQWMSSTVSNSGPWTNVGTDSIQYTPATGITASTYFMATVSCNSTTISAGDTVSIIVPIVLTTTPAARCGTGTVDLAVTGGVGNVFNWYTASTGGSVVGVGNTFTTPSISSTTNYYVAAATNGSVLSNVASPTIGASTFITAAVGWGLRFTANTSFTINTVDIRALNTTAGAATMQIRVTDLADVVLYTGTLHNFSVTTALATYTIPVNITVPPGNYKMVMTYTGLSSMVRESAGLTFPYNSPNGEVSITAGANGVAAAQTTAAYYWFYNWVIGSACESARSMVTATVNPLATTPASLARVVKGTDSILVNWVGNVSSTGYRIDVATDAGFTSMVSGYDNLSVVDTFKSINGLTSGTSYYIRVRAENATSCTSLNSTVLNDTTTTNGATLNVTAFLQGLYLGGGLMTSSPFNYDGVSSPTVADTITVELYNPDYTLAYSVRDTLSTTGQASITFPGSAVGNKYFVVIKHRSSLETWSSDSILIGSTTSYNFSSGAGQAYFDGGANMPLVDDGSGVYLIYSGDITQDGAVDFNDYPDLDSENLLGTYPAYLATDLNADGITDFNDYPLLDANNLLGSLIQRPY